MNEACRGDSRLAATTTSPSSAAILDELPQRIRDIATLRGLGYTFREISKEFAVCPQAISLMLSRHRRVMKRLRGAGELAGLSPRAVNALGRHGIRSRATAFEINVLELLRGERNCGDKTLEEIRRWIDDAASGIDKAQTNRQREAPGSNGRLTEGFGFHSIAIKPSKHPQPGSNRALRLQ